MLKKRYITLIINQLPQIREEHFPVERIQNRICFSSSDFSHLRRLLVSFLADGRKI